MPTKVVTLPRGNSPANKRERERELNREREKHKNITANSAPEVPKFTFLRRHGWTPAPEGPPPVLELKFMSNAPTLSADDMSRMAKAANDATTKAAALLVQYGDLKDQKLRDEIEAARVTVFLQDRLLETELRVRHLEREAGVLKQEHEEALQRQQETTKTALLKMAEERQQEMMGKEREIEKLKKELAEVRNRRVEEEERLKTFEEISKKNEEMEREMVRKEVEAYETLNAARTEMEAELQRRLEEGLQKNLSSAREKMSTEMKMRLDREERAEKERNLLEEKVRDQKDQIESLKSKAKQLKVERDLNAEQTAETSRQLAKAHALNKRLIQAVTTLHSKCTELSEKVESEHRDTLALLGHTAKDISAARQTKSPLLSIQDRTPPSPHLSTFRADLPQQTGSSGGDDSVIRVLQSSVPAPPDGSKAPEVHTHQREITPVEVSGPDLDVIRQDNPHLAALIESFGSDPIPPEGNTTQRSKGSENIQSSRKGRAAVPPLPSLPAPSLDGHTTTQAPLSSIRKVGKPLAARMTKAATARAQVGCTAAAKVRAASEGPDAKRRSAWNGAVVQPQSHRVNPTAAMQLGQAQQSDRSDGKDETVTSLRAKGAVTEQAGQTGGRRRLIGRERFEELQQQEREAHAIERKRRRSAPVSKLRTRMSRLKEMVPYDPPKGVEDVRNFPTEPWNKSSVPDAHSQRVMTSVRLQLSTRVEEQQQRIHDLEVLLEAQKAEVALAKRRCTAILSRRNVLEKFLLEAVQEVRGIAKERRHMILRESHDDDDEKQNSHLDRLQRKPVAPSDRGWESGMITVAPSDKGWESGMITVATTGSRAPQGSEFDADSRRGAPPIHPSGSAASQAHSPGHSFSPSRSHSGSPPATTLSSLRALPAPDSASSSHPPAAPHPPPPRGKEQLEADLQVAVKRHGWTLSPRAPAHPGDPERPPQSTAAAPVFKAGGRQGEGASVADTAGEEGGRETLGRISVRITPERPPTSQNGAIGKREQESQDTKNKPAGAEETDDGRTASSVSLSVAEVAVNTVFQMAATAAGDKRANSPEASLLPHTAAAAAEQNRSMPQKKHAQSHQHPAGAPSEVSGVSPVMTSPVDSQTINSLPLAVGAVPLPPSQEGSKPQQQQQQQQRGGNEAPAEGEGDRMGNMKKTFAQKAYRQISKRSLPTSSMRSLSPPHRVPSQSRQRRGTKTRQADSHGPPHSHALSLTVCTTTRAEAEKAAVRTLAEVYSIRQEQLTVRAAKQKQVNPPHSLSPRGGAIQRRRSLPPPSLAPPRGADHAAPPPGGLIQKAPMHRLWKNKGVPPHMRRLHMDPPGGSEPIGSSLSLNRRGEQVQRMIRRQTEKSGRSRNRGSEREPSASELTLMLEDRERARGSNGNSERPGPTGSRTERKGGRAGGVGSFRRLRFAESSSQGVSHTTRAMPTERVGRGHFAGQDQNGALTFASDHSNALSFCSLSWTDKEAVIELLFKKVHGDRNAMRLLKGALSESILGLQRVGGAPDVQRNMEQTPRHAPTRDSSDLNVTGSVNESARRQGGREGLGGVAETATLTHSQGREKEEGEEREGKRGTAKSSEGQKGPESGGGAGEGLSGNRTGLHERKPRGSSSFSSSSSSSSSSASAVSASGSARLETKVQTQTQPVTSAAQGDAQATCEPAEEEDTGGTFLTAIP